MNRDKFLFESSTDTIAKTTALYITATAIVYFNNRF